MPTTGRTGDILEGTHQVPTYPPPNNINSLPMGYAYGEGNYQFDTTAPSTPTIATPSKTTTTIVLTWGAATDDVGVDHYDIYIAGSKVGQTSNLTATLNGLTTGTTYSIKIKAVDAHGNASAFSNTLSVTTN